tara:strand:- start:622 stop:840 length:219 start_codon:yes stop_codon:yes gene_type:complete
MLNKLYLVTDIDLYLSEVGDGIPEFQLTKQEEYVLNRRCLGRWKATSEDDLRNQIEDFIGHPIMTINYQIRK